MGKFDKKDDKPVITACECSRPVQVGTECWSCYERRTGTADARDKMLYAHLETIGLDRREGETARSWALRCKTWLRETGSLERVISARTAIST